VSELRDLLDRLVGDDEWARHTALDRLRTAGADPDRVAALAAALASDDAASRAGARMALAALAAPGSPSSADATRRVAAALRSADPDLRILAASALGESGNRAVVPELIAALDDPDANVAAAAVDALGELADPRALSPLVESLEDERSWVRLAAVVALGRLRDPAALPALERVAGTPGLQAPVAEAVDRIGDPAGLRVLGVMATTVPDEALVAGGRLLAAHPAVPPPQWVLDGAREREAVWRERLGDRDDPAIARLLGLVGSPEAVESLLDLMGPPRRSEAAVAGLLAVPAEVRLDPILRRLEAAEPRDQVLLLSLLPAVQDRGRIDRLVPLLASADRHVRAAAAEALARSAARYSFAILEEEMDHGHPAPEVVRAVGTLGAAACVALTPLLRDPEPAVRAAAADALARCAVPDVADQIVEALEREDHPEPRRSLLRTLAVVAGAAAVPLLREATDDPDAETRMVAIEALGATGSPAAVPALAAVRARAPAETLAAIGALGELADPDALPLLQPYLRSTDLEQRRAAVRAVVHLGEDLGLPTVDALSRDADPWIRGRSVRLARGLGGAGAAILERLAEADPDPAVRGDARRALAGERE
jgi:HEAT repeat protein